MAEFRREELIWAAGFFDGEGNVRFDPRPGRKNGWTQLQIAQCDRRVLDRFKGAVGGIGAVYGPYAQRQPKSQPYYQYSAQGFMFVQAVVAMLFKWLSPVKREQARKTLEAARAHRA
jgi:hypothetical protein